MREDWGEGDGLELYVRIVEEKRNSAMKLLYCPDCNSVFNLTLEEKECSCGKCKGRYVDFLNAETNGEGICLAMVNSDILHAIKRTISENRIDVIRCWTRPHEGPENPNTKVKKE